MTLRFPSLTRPLRVVQLSDLHFGNTPLRTVHRCIHQALLLRPDVVVLTGDFVDDRFSGSVQPLADALRPLRGAYAVWGDHDYDSGLYRLKPVLDEAGIRVLVNEWVGLPGGLWLGGMDDYERGRPDYPRVLTAMPPGGGLLLCHNPKPFEELDASLPVTMLSGHTHGAQIRIPFPWPALVCRVHLQVATVQGWYSRGNLKVYVNRGVGVAGPWPLNRRVNCPPEVVAFDLIPAGPPSAGCRP